MMIINDISNYKRCVKAIAKAIAKLCVTIVITINGPDHLSDLKAVDDSIFLSESKCYSIFLHPELACHPLCSVRCNTSQLILYKIYKDNHLFVCLSHDKLCIGFKYIRLSSKGFKASLSCL